MPLVTMILRPARHAVRFGIIGAIRSLNCWQAETVGIEGVPLLHGPHTGSPLWTGGW